MSGADPCLSVFLGEQQIASLQLSADQLLWHYAASWQQQGFALSPHLPLHGEIPPLNVQRFLRNLLPEGPGLEELLASFRLARHNTFALVQAIGQETAGALTLLPAGQSPTDTTQFRPLSEPELAERLASRQQLGLTVWDGKPRLSVAGVQDKLNLLLDPQCGMGFGEGRLCSTHILKFERPELPHLVLNEYVTMQLAHACELTVAQAERRVIGGHPALLVTRFDRKADLPTQVRRRHLIDGCQVLNLPPEYKYERNFLYGHKAGSSRDVAHIRDGANLPALFAFAAACRNPALTRKAMLEWVLFNLLVGNADAHGKNLSFFVGKQGIELAPWYDLVNIALYPDFEQDLAMALGDEFNAAAIHAYQLADFADSCHLPRSLVSRQLTILAQRLLRQVADLPARHATTPDEQVYLQRYQQWVEARCHHLLGEVDGIKEMVL